MKMRIRKAYFLLLFIFIFSLGFRLYFVFQTNNFSSDDAYFHLRHINHLVENKNILYYDELSYGGRYILYPPLFHILMALFSFGNIFLLKLIPEILLSSMVFIVYLICKEITKKDIPSLICSLMAGFVPIFLINTINNISVYSLVLPIIFLILYCLVKLNKKLYLILFLFLSLLLSLIHQSVFLIILTALIYFLLSWIEGLKVSNLKKEVILFSIFFIFLIQFLIYRKAFLQYGLNIIFYNIPANLMDSVFKDFQLIPLIFFIGILTLIFGFSGFYYVLSKKDSKLGLIFSSFVIGVLILLLLKLIPFLTGLTFLSLGLIILSSFSISAILNYIEQTRLFKIKYFIILSFVFVVFVLSFVPAYDSLADFNYIFDQKIHDLNWIKKNTEEGVVVLGLLEEGNLITSISNRKNVFDTNFLLAPNPFKRIEDVNEIYSSDSLFLAVELLKEYKVNYIYFSDKAQRIYNNGLNYIDDKSCFKRVRGRIYEVIC